MLSDGLLSFCEGCGDGEGRCNGRGKQGKDALSVCALSFARMQNHTSTLMIAVRKASGIVRFWARVANDKNIKKRSQHITVTAFIDYCFV